MRKKWIYEGKWIVFYFSWGFEISYELCGYFDSRHSINLNLLFFRLAINLPIYSKKYTDECNPPKYGIAYHHQKLWIYMGGKGNMNGGNKWWTFTVPWSYEWVRTSNLRKDGTWEHERRGNRKDFWDDKWNIILWKETYPYIYILKSGEVQIRTATLRVEEREWRWHWLKWLPFPRMIRRTIDIDFNDEVGERTGSWKGGTMGCSWELKNGESPEEALRRMERERKF